MYATSFRLLIVKKPWGFSSIIMLARMAVLNVSCHTCHSPKGLHQTPPISVREASVSARLSRGCDGVVLRWGRVSIAWYLTVSLVAQNKAAYSTYPMGIDE